MNKPNFFIVGAPKCGTTALSEYIRTHHNVFMCTPKEPSFFCFDLPGLQYVTSRKDYEQLFSKAKSRHSIIGEASPGYLISEVAIKNIYEYNKDSRIIVMLRNPAEMLPSYHSQLQFSGFEDQADFKTAWDMQHERLQGKHIPKKCREPKLLQYSTIPRFGDQLDRLFTTFPKEQILLLDFDTFIKTPKASYDATLEFLGISNDGRSEFPVINPNKGTRSKLLNDFLHNPPKLAKRVMNKISGKSLHDLLVRFHGSLKQSNTVHTTRKPIDTEFYNELIDTFAPQIEEAERITGLDLSAWKIHK